MDPLSFNEAHEAAGIRLPDDLHEGYDPPQRIALLEISYVRVLDRLQERLDETKKRLKAGNLFLMRRAGKEGRLVLHDQGEPVLVTDNERREHERL